MYSPKITFILSLALPPMRQSASWIRAEDEESTKVDDFAAQVLDGAAQFLEDVLTNPAAPSAAADKIAAAIADYHAALDEPAEDEEDDIDDDDDDDDEKPKKPTPKPAPAKPKPPSRKK